METFLKVPMTVQMASGVEPGCIYLASQKQVSMLCNMNLNEID